MEPRAWGLFWALEFLKNLISSLSYGRYRLVPNRGTFWRIFPLLRTFSCFHCFHFHYVLFFAISFQTPLKNPSRRASGTKASGFVPPALRAGFLRGVIILKTPPPMRTRDKVCASQTENERAVCGSMSGNDLKLFSALGPRIICKWNDPKYEKYWQN